MSLYLQRLLDRAAPPPVQVSGANPLLVSGSPILTFDQRLASAEMADDFSILGATPDLPDATDEAPPTAPAVVRQNGPGAPPIPALPRVEPRGEHPSPVLPTRPANPLASHPALPEFVKARETGDAAPESPRRVSGTRAVDPPRQPPAALLEPNVPPAQPLPVQGEQDRPSLPPTTPAEPSPASAEAMPGPSAAQAAVGDRPPQPETEPAPVPPKVSEARPQLPTNDAVREAPRSVPGHAEAKPAPAAEPIVAPIPPLAPPPRGLSAREVERMIEEAIGAERERSAARQSVPLRTQPPQAPVPQGEAPSKRPVTAAQASLIGSLESSRFRPMLFGVRRR